MSIAAFNFGVKWTCYIMRLVEACLFSIYLYGVSGKIATLLSLLRLYHSLGPWVFMLRINASLVRITFFCYAIWGHYRKRAESIFRVPGERPRR